jgi:hypothetical protein
VVPDRGKYKFFMKYLQKCTKYACWLKMHINMKNVQKFEKCAEM